MKRSLLAVAVLGAFAGAASAQSSVTVYGTIDLSAKYVKNDGSDRRYSLSQDGINSSQLGFKGTEDLGGGLMAGFVFLSGVNADTGSSNTQFWNRRSTVSLWGKFGEIRVGRDYTPSFWNQTIFDPFGANGIAASFDISQMGTATLVRANNTIGYFLPPNLGGVYGQVMVAASEGASGPTLYGTANVGANPGRYVGGRVGWASGPVDVAGSFAEQRFDALLNAPQQKIYSLGGAYDLGVVKLMGFFNRDTLTYTGVDRKENRGTFGAVVPLGQGEIHTSYSLAKFDNNGVTTKIDQIGLGYVYNLSKRTAVYSTVARMNNKDATRLSISGGTTQTAPPIAGGKSTGAEFGLRHFF